MLKKSVILIFALSAVNSTAADQQNELELRTRTPVFLQPLKVKAVLPPDHPLLPQFCARSGKLRCPPIVSGGIPGGLTPDDFQLYLPHVRVSFLAYEISNEVVANGGVQGATLEWTTNSTEADTQKGGPAAPYAFAVPEPGETYDFAHGILMYDALVFNACGSFSSFPVEHEATVSGMLSGATGSFVAVDNSTIDSTGYYNLSYTIRVEDSDGGRSDVHIQGKARAICSGLNSL